MTKKQEFNPGDILCLKWDKSKRFIVTFDPLNMQSIKYFNESTGTLCTADVPKEYLIKIATIETDNSLANDKLECQTDK